MICPRCRSVSILRSHGTTACLPCGHVIEEPARQPWDISFPATGGNPHGPAWTADELALWRPENASQP